MGRHMCISCSFFISWSLFIVQRLRLRNIFIAKNSPKNMNKLFGLNVSKIPVHD